MFKLAKNMISDADVLFLIDTTDQHTASRFRVFFKWFNAGPMSSCAGMKEHGAAPSSSRLLHGSGGAYVARLEDRGVSWAGIGWH